MANSMVRKMLTYITSTRQTAGEQQTLTVEVKAAHLQPTDEIIVSAWDGGQQMA